MLLRQLGKRLLARTPNGLATTAIREKRAFDTVEEEVAHSNSMKLYGKAGYDFEYLFNLEKTKLVYKVIRLQRQVDSYVTMKSLKNVDGRDKIRVEHPDPEELVDHFEYGLRRVAFRVMYVGWDYMAYAWSERADRKITGHTNVVERVFLEALLRQQLVQKVGRRIHLERAGRTDAGVSGVSQVICVNVRSNFEEGYGVWTRKRTRSEEKNGDQTSRESRNDVTVDNTAGEAYDISNAEDSGSNVLPKKFYREDYKEDPRFNVKDTSQDHLELPYLEMLNNALPPDIRVVAWSPVGRYFSARASCKRRTYRYVFPRANVDVDLMNKAAQRLVGEHDFRNFGKLSSDNMFQATTRKLHAFKVEVLRSSSDPALPECDICVATATASGFIYRQVRLMLAVLCAIGQGYQEPSIIDQLLDVDETKGRPSYSSLHAFPLMLYNTEFDEDEVSWRWDDSALVNTAESMGEMWCDVAMRAEVLRTMYGAAIQNLAERDKASAKVYLLSHLQTHDGREEMRDLRNLALSSSREEFQSKAKEKQVRRWMRMGRYHKAAKVHSGEDTDFGWKS